MEKGNIPVVKGCALLAGFVAGVLLLVVGVVAVKTWVPLREAGEAREKLDLALGALADYHPDPSGAIFPERMRVFLELRAVLVTACDDYGSVRKGFETVAALEERDPGNPEEVGDVVVEFGGAALSITPFLARFFERRNEALLSAPMGLEEYAYIYATAYHDLLLSRSTRREIFSDGDALSPEASEMLRNCLVRQLDAGAGDGAGSGATAGQPDREALETEIRKMAADSTRLIWQEGLPEAVHASLEPFRDRLDRLFCGASAGLEMEGDSRRALRLALE